MCAFKNAVVFLVALAAVCVGQSKWDVQPLVNQKKDLNSLAYGNNQFVAVGDSGIILTSPDGISWTVQQSGTTEMLTCIEFSQKRFVTVGLHGTILSSSDGVLWTSQNVDQASSLLFIAHSENETYWYIGCRDCDIRRSTDLKNWSVKTCKFADYGMANVNGIWVGVGRYIMNTASDPFIDGCIYGYGVNGTLNSVAFGNGMYVVAGYASTPGPLIQYAYGSDYQRWWGTANLPAPVSGKPGFTSLNSVAFAAGCFVAVGGYIITSLNGISWTRVDAAFPDLEGIAYGNGLFVAVGNVGTIVSSVADNPSRAAGKNALVTRRHAAEISVSNKYIIIMNTHGARDRMKVEFFTQRGKRIYTETHGTGDGVLNIPVAIFVPGVYTMRIPSSNGGTTSKSLVITR